MTANNCGQQRWKDLNHLRTIAFNVYPKHLFLIPLWIMHSPAALRSTVQSLEQQLQSLDEQMRGALVCVNQLHPHPCFFCVATVNTATLQGKVSEYKQAFDEYKTFQDASVKPGLQRFGLDQLKVCPTSQNVADSPVLLPFSAGR